MGKNKKKKTKVKTISLEEFTDSHAKQEEIILPTAPMEFIAKDESSGWRTPVSKEDTFFANNDGEEIDWSRGADMTTSAPVTSDPSESSDWRLDAEVSGPTSAPVTNNDSDHDWRRDSDSVKPTSAPQKSASDTDTDWRKSAKTNGQRAYRPPARGNWRDAANGPEICRQIISL